MMIIFGKLILFKLRVIWKKIMIWILLNIH